ncbi:hypothetical protein T552_01379 [Pneumocystis carinii B80]|uniref:PWWP domain-containing protein n=1 Tax=Pneumocystis carinii (strain B80) TaxID=1408658 RepID=A0A0W4ZM39_PNEC8|nr:hypothetical protein T552_01379 [Pneumocystis carinii B80]KTW29427.1 hypothetical protein T552_01379 [Pneumocystis carinii B80]
MGNSETEEKLLDESECSEIKDLKSEKNQDNEIDRKKDNMKMEGKETGVSIYNVGDLVLAKISGYPWWPGMVFPEDIAPKEVIDARPVSKKRRNGMDVQYWLVRFFPEPEFIWASKNDIRPLTMQMVDDFLSRKSTKKDIRRSYEIAKTCPTVEDLLAQQSLEMEDGLEKDEDEDEFNDNLKDDNIDDDDDDDDDVIKGTLKRRIDSRKGENKKRRHENDQNKTKLNNKEKAITGDSQKNLNKVMNGKVKSEENSINSSEQSLQIKWEQKRQHVLFFRHKLQRIMLTNERIPSETDMSIVNEQLQKLEAFKGIDAEILRATKIGKVLKRIICITNIPGDEKYFIKERSRKLLDSWKIMLEKPNDIGEDQEEKASSERI